ncbi:9652_t:CDS:2 [Acaulospora morrowiae]|uniref:9652_t:CDS:1 n=1 Tax=Acaulospora morrowiae TaxID=94023 RepID=A0A9N9B8V3_9GLOM|nr:9652_t:CDS:2 [Acaulospora morrowiae]
MPNLVSKVDALFLEGSLDAICSATVIYLTRKGTTLQPLPLVKDLAERAVNSSLTKITDFERRMKVLEILPQMEVGYKSVVGLDASPVRICDEFVNNFNNIEVPDVLRNIVHNKEWKEEEIKLIERTNRILSVLEGVWNNPAFATSEMRSSQSEGTYITDVIVPLLRSGLDDLPNGSICMSTAERQSMASKIRKSLGVNEERSSCPPKVPIGKKPDVMLMEKCGGKIFELAYVESSRVVCTNSKKENDSIKLWRETLDGVSLIGTACRPTSNQFGIIGIQVAGEDLCLNVLVKDANGIPRYLHLIQAPIPFTKNTSWRVKPLIHLLLTSRNITIVNKSLLIQALEQASTRPPRNVNPSPTVSSPIYD